MKKTIPHFDYILFGLIAGLTVIGLAVLYSASTVESYKNFGNTSYYAFHQFLYGGLIGMTGLYIFSRIDYHFWQKVAPFLLLGGIVLLLLVKVPGLSFSSGGATRWLSVGPIFFQPSELVKLAMIMYVAAWVSKKQFSFPNFLQDVLPLLLVLALVAFLIIWQPDVGTTMVLVLTSVVMLFAGGLPLKNFFWIVMVGLAGLAVLIRLEPYRLQRLMTFLDPSHDTQGIGYQINQALLAIGSGGLGGYGYGLSRQKYSYLPEAINDSIFAIMAEEFGFIRTVLIVALFVLLGLRGFKVSLKAADGFGKILGIGIIAHLLIQVFINIAAITSLLPLTGIPLPFFSYGSTSLIVVLSSLGILLNISRSARRV